MLPGVTVSTQMAAKSFYVFVPAGKESKISSDSVPERRKMRLNSPQLTYIALNSWLWLAGMLCPMRLQSGVGCKWFCTNITDKISSLGMRLFVFDHNEFQGEPEI